MTKAPADLIFIQVGSTTASAAGKEKKRAPEEKKWSEASAVSHLQSKIWLLYACEKKSMTQSPT